MTLTEATSKVNTTKSTTTPPVTTNEKMLAHLRNAFPAPKGCTKADYKKLWEDCPGRKVNYRINFWGEKNCEKNLGSARGKTVEIMQDNYIMLSYFVVVEVNQAGEITTRIKSEDR